MEIRLLGPFEVLEGDVVAAALGGPRHRMVLAMLALAAPAVVSTDHLVDGLWGESPPDKPLGALQVFIHKLRSGLADLGVDDPRALLQTRPPGYRLLLEPTATDAGQFESLLTQARQAAATGDTEASYELLDRALALWRGPALSDLRGAPFAEPLAVRLDELRVGAEEDRLEAALSLGKHHEVVGRLEDLVHEHPTRERFWALLMTALYRCERQADALLAYGRARETLADELGIDPGAALRQLEVGILRQDPDLAAPASRKVSTVPAEPGSTPVAGLDPAAPVVSPPALPRDAARVPVPLNRTIGRELLVDSVLAWLRRPDVHVVTLTGLGGTGKSRVASLASGLAAQEAVLVCFLVVTEQTSAGQLLREAAMVLAGQAGDDPLEDLAQLPAGQPEPLLVLDNLEALGEGGDLVQRLVSRCPGLTVMVTSRIALGIPGEWEVAVPPLAVPEEGATPAASASAPAVRLFVDRAEAVDATFELAGQEGDVGALCRLLDGVPLALELAAARVTTTSVPRLLATLREGLELLTTASSAVPARHRSLTATIEWSYERLDPVARRVCDRLALFERGFTIEAVEAVCGDVPHVLEIVGDILAARLIRPVETRVEVRFVVLGTVRAFARSRLATHADLDERRLQLAQHLVAKLQEWGEGLDGDQGLVALARFDDEAADVDACLGWAVALREPKLAVALAEAATPFWVASGRLHDARRHLDGVLTMADVMTDSSAALQARAAWVAYQLSDWTAAMTIGRRALAAIDEANDPTSVAIARCAIAGALAVSGSSEEASVLAETCLSACVGASLYPWAAVASSVVAIACAVRGDFEGERAAYEERLQVVRRQGDIARTADTLNTLAEIALDDGDALGAAAYAEQSLLLAEGRLLLETRDATITLARAAAASHEPDAARRWLSQALDLSDRTGQALALAQCLRTGGLLASMSDDPAGAVRLFAAAQTLSPSPSGGNDPVEHDFSVALERARAALGTAFGREWSLGSVLPVSSARSLVDGMVRSVPDGS